MQGSLPQCTHKHAHTHTHVPTYTLHTHTNLFTRGYVILELSEGLPQQVVLFSGGGQLGG